MAYDFSGLTSTQQALLTYRGWETGSFLPCPTARTLKRLLERGLIVVTSRVLFGLTVTEYAVPLDVHMEWCEHCSCRMG